MNRPQPIVAANAPERSGSSRSRRGSDTAFSARGLSHRFGPRWAISHLDVAAIRGEVLLIAGSNGSGKTTLLRLLSGLLRPTRGELEVLGRSHTREPLGLRRNVSLLAHASYLYEPLTALETIGLWATLLGRSSAVSELHERLAEVGLAEHAHSPISGFSAGMRKRLSFARVRLEDSDLVLLDEPFAALDGPGQESMTQWIAALRAAGRTVVLASHNLERATSLADRAILLDHGQMIWQGSPRQLPGVIAEAL